MSFIERLKFIRDNITQEEFARKIGTGRAAFKGWEYGVCLLSSKNLLKFYNNLGLCPQITVGINFAVAQKEGGYFFRKVWLFDYPLCFPGYFFLTIFSLSKLFLNDLVINKGESFCQTGKWGQKMGSSLCLTLGGK